MIKRNSVSFVCNGMVMRSQSLDTTSLTPCNVTKKRRSCKISCFCWGLSCHNTKTDSGGNPNVYSKEAEGLKVFQGKKRISERAYMSCFEKITIV